MYQSIWFKKLKSLSRIFPYTRRYAILIGLIKSWKWPIFLGRISKHRELWEEEQRHEDVEETWHVGDEQAMCHVALSYKSH